MAKLLSTMVQCHAPSVTGLAHHLELPVSSGSNGLLCKSDMNDVSENRLLIVYYPVILPPTQPSTSKASPTSRAQLAA